jgi:hypothetical protein
MMIILLKHWICVRVDSLADLRDVLQKEHVFHERWHLEKFLLQRKE